MFAKCPRGLAVLGGGELAATRGFRTCSPRLEDSDEGEAGGSERGSSFGIAVGRGRDGHGGGPRGRGGPPPGGRGGPSLGWRGGPPPGGRGGPPPHRKSGPPLGGPSQWDGPSRSQPSKARPHGSGTDDVSSDAILGAQMGRSSDTSHPGDGPSPGGRGGAPAVGGEYPRGPRGRGGPPHGGYSGGARLDERDANRGPVSGERRARGRGGSFPGREQREGEPGFADGEQRRGRADTVGMGAKSKVSASRSSAASGSLEEYAPAGSEGDTADLFESDTEELATEGDLQIEPDVDLSALFGDMEDQKPEGLRYAKPFRRDPDNLRPQMLYKEERELKYRREEKLGETLRRQERMDNQRAQRYDRKPRQLDPARARQIQRVLADNERKEIHYNELVKYGKHAPEVFKPVMEDIETVVPGLPEAHWMRSYLKTSIAAVNNNEQLTPKDRTRFVSNIVRTLQAINEKLKENKESDSGDAGSQ